MLSTIPHGNNTCQAYTLQAVRAALHRGDTRCMNSILDRQALGAALRTARLEAGLTQAQLAERVAALLEAETKQANISKIEKGEVGASFEMLQAIATALGTRTSKVYQIAEESGSYHIPSERAPESPRADVRMVPLVSWVQAGQPTEIAAAYNRKDPDGWVATGSRVSRNAFALRVKGRSMTNPSPAGHSFPEGTVIVVDPTILPRHGALVIARFDDDDEATFKRLEEDGGDRMIRQSPVRPAFQRLLWFVPQVPRANLAES